MPRLICFYSFVKPSAYNVAVGSDKILLWLFNVHIFAICGNGAEISEEPERIFRVGVKRQITQDKENVCPEIALSRLRDLEGQRWNSYLST